MALHYTADEDKRGDWGVVTSQGVPVREWDREMELKEDVYDGVPVFADYSDTRHCPLSIREKGIPIFPQAAYIGGWDGGLVPAFVLIHITTEFQIHALVEVVSDGDDPIETFAPRVLRECERRIPGRYDEIYHTGDPTIWNRTPGTGESAGQLANRKFGINIRRSTNIWETRRSAVTWALLDRLDNGDARFIIDPRKRDEKAQHVSVGCETLRRGFQGAYEFEISPQGDTVGAGRILAEPLKNGYSHVHDSLQYSLIAARKFCDGKLNLR